MLLLFVLLWEHVALNGWPPRERSPRRAIAGERCTWAAKRRIEREGQDVVQEKKLRCCCCQHGEFQDLTFKFRKFDGTRWRLCWMMNIWCSSELKLSLRFLTVSCRWMVVRFASDLPQCHVSECDCRTVPKGMQRMILFCCFGFIARKSVQLT